jgi:hypothetical protein
LTLTAVDWKSARTLDFSYEEALLLKTKNKKFEEEKDRGSGYNSKIIQKTTRLN